MSFQPTPETLLLEINVRIADLQDRLQKNIERINFVNQQPTGGVGQFDAAQNQRLKTVELERLGNEVTSLQDQSSKLEVQRQSLEQQVDLKLEQLQEIQVTEEQLQPLEQLQPTELPQPVQEQKKENGFSLRNIAIIGAVLLLIS